MFQILIVVLFVWLLLKSTGLILRLAWGTAKIIACILCALSLPLLLIGLLFAWGFLLLLPLGLALLAFILLKELV